MTYPNYNCNPNYYYPQPQMPQQTVSNGNGSSSFVGVQNEQEARSYPVAPGNSVMFRDEYAPYIYAKTMGKSALDMPVFEKYRLVKEDSVSMASEPSEMPSKEKDIDLSVYALKDDFKGVYDRINGMQKEINNLREKFKKRIMREVDEDDE